MLNTCKVDAETLNEVVNFDVPFHVFPPEWIAEDWNLDSPEVYIYVGEDGAVEGPFLEGGGWEPVTGFSGQWQYRGPIMHASEQLQGGIAKAVLENPGVYCVVVVECYD